MNEGHKQGDLGKPLTEKKESQERGGVPGSGSTTGQTMETEPVTELFLTSMLCLTLKTEKVKLESN